MKLIQLSLVAIHAIDANNKRKAFLRREEKIKQRIRGK